MDWSPRGLGARDPVSSLLVSYRPLAALESRESTGAFVCQRSAIFSQLRYLLLISSLLASPVTSVRKSGEHCINGDHSSR